MRPERYFSIIQLSNSRKKTGRYRDSHSRVCFFSVLFMALPLFP